MSPRLSARFAFAAFLACLSIAFAVRPSTAQTIIDYAPVVSAPDTSDAVEGAPLSFGVTAFDPNEEAITSLTASGTAFDHGAVFSLTTDFHDAGTLSWTPTFGQAGVYTATFTASNSLSGSKTTVIRVAAGDHPPVVSAPRAINGEEGGDLSFVVTASDADGDPLSLSANLAALPVESGATFLTNEANTVGTFHWHMNPGDAGSYDVIFTAISNDVSRSATTHIKVGPAGTSITGVFTWTPKPGDEGVYHVTFTAADAGGSTSAVETLTVVSPPPSPAPAAPLAPRAPGAALGPQAPQKGPIISGTGSITTTTGIPVTVSVSASTDPTTPNPAAKPAAPIRLSAGVVQTTTLTADLSELPPGNDAMFVVDQQPVISGPSAVTVPPGAPMTLTRTAADPDGDAIDSFTANLSGLPPANPGTFTVNGSKTSGTLTWTPRLIDVGTYVVNLSASNRLVGTASTTITVAAAAAARIFAIEDGETRERPVDFGIGSNGGNGCIKIEPVSGSFAVSDVAVGSIRLISTGTGILSEIPVRARSATIADRNRNGIPELSVCFDRAGLNALFSLLKKKTVVTVQIQGQLVSGAYFAGSVAATVDPLGHNSAGVSPNPLNPQAKLSLVIGRSGRLKVTIYDMQGRLVRELANEPSVAPGPREIPIDGKDSKGALLASGVYFYRVESADGVRNGRFAIVR